MSNAAISVKGLKKSFKDKEVLKGVDFEVRPGEIFALQVQMERAKRRRSISSQR
jgi:ABC-type transporter Mla maintaining outer membrane lipid asymmetry ATPase subunit MlaF